MATYRMVPPSEKSGLKNGLKSGPPKRFETTREALRPLIARWLDMTGRQLFDTARQRAVKRGVGALVVTFTQAHLLDFKALETSPPEDVVYMTPTDFQTQAWAMNPIVYDYQPHTHYILAVRIWVIELDEWFDQMFMRISAYESLCRNLGCVDEPLRRCARCHSARYCDAECQRADWPLHKLECAKMTLSAAADPMQT